MALANGTFSFYAATIGDVNPWTNAIITALDGSAYIGSGVFRQNTFPYPAPQRFRYNGSVTGITTMRISMQTTVGYGYNQQNIGFVNAAGNGYMLTWFAGSLLCLIRIDNNVLTGISPGVEEPVVGGTAADAIFHLDINLTTGLMQVYYENPNGAVPVTTPTLIPDLNTTDTTYITSDLSPSLIMRNEDTDGFFINAWGATLGGAASSATPTPTVTTTPTSTPTVTPTSTITATPTPTLGVTPTSTSTVTPTRTLTPTPTVTPSSNSAVVTVNQRLYNLSAATVPSVTGITAVIYRTPPTSSNTTPHQIVENISSDSNGYISFQINNTGLSVNDPIWLILMKDGTPARGSLRKITPTYT